MNDLTPRTLDLELHLSRATYRSWNRSSCEVPRLPVAHWDSTNWSTGFQSKLWAYKLQLKDTPPLTDVWWPVAQALLDFPVLPSQHLQLGQHQILLGMNKSLGADLAVSDVCVWNLAYNPVPPPQYSLRAFAKRSRPAGRWLLLGGLPRGSLW